LPGTGGTLPGTGGTTGGGHWERGPAPTTQSASARGPYNVATYTNGMRDAPGYADSTMHYPTDAEPPFAGVAVVHGYLSPQSSIQAWGQFLASHGIVTLTIGTNSGGDPPATRATALLDAIETIRSESDRAGGQLAGNIQKDRMAIMGWSMGGGGTLIAANMTPTLKAAISLCGWNPGGRYPQDVVPCLLFAAVSDGLAGGQSQGFYSSIPETTPKMLYEASPGSHSVANNPASQSGEIGRYGLSWMKVFLEGDERYRQFLLQAPTQSVRDFQTNVQ
jgi:dienelactone hydrolase